VLYVVVQRALAAGASVLGNTRQLVAGDPADNDPAEWQRVIAAAEALSTEYPFHRGIYTSGEKLLAVNRPAVETRRESLPIRKFRTCSAGSISRASTIRREVWAH